MPVYKKGDRWRIVIQRQGHRRDAICRGSETDAARMEQALREQMELDFPDEEWRRRARSSDPIVFYTEQVWIYFIQAGDGGPIKIGRATNVLDRMSSMQSDNHERLKLIGVTEGRRSRERELHARFRHLRMHGEWFRPEDDLVKYVQEVTAEWARSGQETP